MNVSLLGVDELGIWTLVAPPGVLFLGALLGLLGGLFVSIGRIVLDVVRAVVPVIQQVVDILRAVVNRIAENAGRFFRFISRASRSLFRDVLKPLVDSVRTYYARFKNFLLRVFAPVIRIFDAVQRVLNKIWDRVISPILSAFDKVRAALKILSKLGVPFAKELERILQRIQSEIFTRFRMIQNWVNTATFWLDLLLDPRGWIRATPFLFTVFRFSGNVVNLITKLADGDGMNRELVLAARTENPPRGVDVVVERVKTGAIRESDAVQSAAARFRSRQSGRVA